MDFNLNNMNIYTAKPAASDKKLGFGISGKSFVNVLRLDAAGKDKKGMVPFIKQEVEDGLTENTLKFSKIMSKSCPISEDKARQQAKDTIGLNQQRIADLKKGWLGPSKDEKDMAERLDSIIGDIKISVAKAKEFLGKNFNQKGLEKLVGGSDHLEA